jgi:hypothetical protein
MTRFGRVARKSATYASSERSPTVKRVSACTLSTSRLHRRNPSRWMNMNRPDSLTLMAIDIELSPKFKRSKGEKCCCPVVYPDVDRKQAQHLADVACTCVSKAARPPVCRSRYRATSHAHHHLTRLFVGSHRAATFGELGDRLGREDLPRRAVGVAHSDHVRVSAADALSSSSKRRPVRLLETKRGDQDIVGRSEPGSRRSGAPRRKPS